MRLWHRLKALRPSKTTVGATWAQLWQHIVRQVIRSRPKSPISLDSPRKAGIRKPKSPGAKTASRGPKNVRPRRPLTARDYIGLFNPILADSERLEAANRILSASKIPLELRCRAKRNVDVYSRSLQAKLNHVVRTASLGQVKDPATVLPDSTYEKVQQYRDVIVAFIRSNLHDLDPHHELIITQSRLEQGSRRLSTHKPPTTNAFIDMLSRKETSLQQEQLKAAVYRVALMTCRRNLEKAVRELVNLHAFNETYIGTEPYGPVERTPDVELGELDQDPTLRARWRKAQRDLATAENALEQHEGRNADFTAWTKEATAARNQGVAGPQVESFRDERLKKHRALYEHLQGTCT